MRPLKLEAGDAKNLNKTGELGWTLLHEAVVNQDYDTVKRLLELGVDPDVQDSFTTSAGVATKSGLSKKEVDKIRKAKFEPIISDLNPNITLNGCTALHYAVL